MNADEHSGEAVPLDPAVTRDLFLQWRSPRLGSSNPERMNNPGWEWLAKPRINAYQANQCMNGPSAMDAGPGWCFDRFGQSASELPDGRTVFIAGEHEDHYDPDFHLFDYQQAFWEKQIPALGETGGELATIRKQFEIPSLEDQLGKPPDLELFARLHKPAVAHEDLAEAEDEFSVHRIEVDGVVVRYAEGMEAIQMTVEGELPEKTLEVLTRDLLEKLSQIGNAACELIRL